MKRERERERLTRWWRWEVSVRDVKRKEKVKKRQRATVMAQPNTLKLNLTPAPLSAVRAVRWFAIFVGFD
jgi:hypothetical protein